MDTDFGSFHLSYFFLCILKIMDFLKQKFLFLILIILIPLIEIYLFIKIGSSIGAFNTISLILVTAIVGVYYARYEGLNTLKSAISQIVTNKLPIYEITLSKLQKEGIDSLFITGGLAALETGTTTSP